ncbi:MAG: hypothetical protein K0S11_527 [Gammaproteobacteria bacterium]|jgi:hypothetical protein|nr:hypothetical protein [Gammaproteobacteria bacterium]
MKIFLSATFKRLAKKLHVKQKVELEKAIAKNTVNPSPG